MAILVNPLTCPICRQDIIRRAVFRWHPELQFLMCQECDSTWETGELQPNTGNFEPLTDRCERLDLEERWDELVFTEFTRGSE